MRHVKLQAFVLAVVEAAAGGWTEAEAGAVTGTRDESGDAEKRGLDDEVSTFGPVLRGFLDELGGSVAGVLELSGALRFLAVPLLFVVTGTSESGAIFDWDPVWLEVKLIISTTDEDARIVLAMGK